MMENRIENIINGALELNAKINEKIQAIDNCEVFIKKLDEGNLSLLMPEGKILSLEPAITMEQIGSVMEGIRALARQNVENAVHFLENVSGQKQEAPLQVPVDTIPELEWEPMMALEPEMTPADYSYAEKVASKPKKPTVPEEVKRKVPVSKMTIAAVEQMFRDGYTVEDIAKHYEYKTTQTVYNFIKKNNIKVKNLTQGNSSKTLTEANIPEIRAMYTEGPHNLADTAWELGVTKKTLHEFCMKHNLMRAKTNL